MGDDVLAKLSGTLADINNMRLPAETLDLNGVNYRIYSFEAVLEDEMTSAAGFFISSHSSNPLL